MTGAGSVGAGSSGDGWTGSVAAVRPATASELLEVRAVSSTSGPAVESVDEPADVVAALVLAVVGVTGLHPGRFGEVATYLPGRRVTGIALTADRAEVHVVLAFGTPVRAVAEEVHAVVAAAVDVPVHVFVEDLAAPHAA